MALSIWYSFCYVWVFVFADSHCMKFTEGLSYYRINEWVQSIKDTLRAEKVLYKLHV